MRAREPGASAGNVTVLPKLDMPTTERPYRQYALEQLRSVAQTAGAARDIDRLCAVVYELGLRSTRGAATLLRETQGALTALRIPEVKLGSTSGVTHLGIPEPQRQPLEYDDEQRFVVDAGAEANVIVNAPPGTGKTAVACGRIASLLGRGVPPHSIWLVSFTRTAVAELRDRIAVLASADASVHSVVAGTVDSRAWRLLQGFTDDGPTALLGGYDCTIAAATALLKQPTHDLRERLDEVLHLIIDEAQDLVGERARLLAMLVRALPHEAGVTVLCDEAQAIYGFSEEHLPEEESPPHASLVNILRRDDKRKFSEVVLRTVHRTESMRLRQLFVDVRAELLDTIRRDPGSAPELVRKRVESLRDGPTSLVQDNAPGDGELLLFRRRIEALDQAAWLASSGKVLRVRTSGLPRSIHPWVGVLLSAWTGERLSRDDFDARWTLVEASLGMLAPKRDRAWLALHGTAPDGVGIDLRQFRATLARSAPPDIFLTAEFGLSGPIFSTIHASKGREAAQVRLYVPPPAKLEGVAAAEEARVLFVGATRARATLQTCRIPAGHASYLLSKRAFRRVHGGSSMRARIEIGRDGDFDPYTVVCGSEPAAVDTAQRFLREGVFGRTIRCRAVRPQGTRGFQYSLQPALLPGGEEVHLGRFASHMKRELYGVANELWGDRQLRLPSYIDNLYCIGARTIVAAPDDPGLSAACEPFATSGIWLSPLVVGLPTVPFFSLRQE